MKYFNLILLLFFFIDLAGQDHEQPPASITYVSDYHSDIIFRAPLMKNFRNNPYVRFEVSYQSVPDAAKVAFQQVLDIYSAQLISKIPIKINLSFNNLESNILASTGAKSIYKNFKNAPKSETWFAVSLAESLAAENLNGTDVDINIKVNSTINWSFNTNSQISIYDYDFISVMVHELAHGLGFSSSASIDPTSKKGVLGYKNVNYIYDEFLMDQNLVLLSTYVNPSQELKEAFTSSQVLFFCDRLNTGERYFQLYAPLEFKASSSISHFDIFSTSLMNPSFSPSQIYRQLDEPTLSVLYQIGWGIQSLEGAVITETEKELKESILIFPNPSSSILRIADNEKKYKKLYVFNSMGIQLLEQDNTHNQIDISKLPIGTYTLALETFDSKFSYKRFIKSN